MNQPTLVTIAEVTALVRKFSWIILHENTVCRVVMKTIIEDFNEIGGFLRRKGKNEVVMKTVTYKLKSNL